MAKIKEKLKAKKEPIIAVLLLFLAAGIVYNIYMDNQMRDNLIVLNDNLIALNEQLISTSKNLSAEISLVEISLENLEGDTKQKIDTLNTLIDEVETKTNIKLSEVKDELENINIQNQDLTVIVDQALPSVVSIITDVGKGSGVFIRNDGYVVTNVHVLSGASLARVKTHKGKTYNAILAGYDQVIDIAVLKIDANYPRLFFGDSDALKVGQSVLAMGNPAGLEFTVTEGIVSATKREISGSSVKFIQTDVPINPGNSGGPLISKEAKIVGINNWKVGGFEGLGFAIPSNLVKDITNDIIDEYETKLVGEG